MIKKNNLIKQKISLTSNPIMKQLYRHEIRLNIQDINIECLNDIKSEELLNKQENDSMNNVLDNLGEINKLKESYQ